MALLLAGLVPLAACMKVTHVTGLNPGDVAQRQKSHGFIWGLVGGDPVELKALCPSGVAMFRSYESAGDGLVALLTLGIYTPMTAEVRCAGGQAFHLRSGFWDGGMVVTPVDDLASPVVASEDTE
jgi:hypothetical protein